MSTRRTGSQWTTLKVPGTRKLSSGVTRSGAPRFSTGRGASATLPTLSSGPKRKWSL